MAGKEFWGHYCGMCHIRYVSHINKKKIQAVRNSMLTKQTQFHEWHTGAQIRGHLKCGPILSNVRGRMWERIFEVCVVCVLGAVVQDMGSLALPWEYLLSYNDVNAVLGASPSKINKALQTTWGTCKDLYSIKRKAAYRRQTTQGEIEEWRGTKPLSQFFFILREGGSAPPLMPCGSSTAQGGETSSFALWPQARHTIDAEQTL